MLGGAQVTSQTSGAGAGGAVTVSVSGAALLSGTGPSDNPSGVTANSTATGRSGNAGSVALTAGSLQVLDGASIASQTFGSGRGGDVNVVVGGTAMLSGASPLGSPSAIAANTNASADGGPAGAVTLSAGSLQLLGGVQVASSTIGSGAGGNVAVNVSGPATLSGADPSNSNSGIFATTKGTGSAGSITLNAQGLQVLDGGQISSQTAASGAGGDVTVAVSGLALLSAPAPSTVPRGSRRIPRPPVLVATPAR